MAQQQQPQQDPQRTIYQVGEGPTSIDGVEARDLPDKGRGPIDSIPGKVLARKTPMQTGATPDSDVTLHAPADITNSKSHPHRKHS